MKYDVVTLAMDLAIASHKGQVDKCGVPYIEHVAEVANLVLRDYRTVNIHKAGAVAWLHDVVEDTEVTMEAIVRKFPPKIAEAVEAITHIDNEPYWDYIRRVKANDIATCVKIADLKHNMDPDRAMRIIEPHDHIRVINVLVPRYYTAYGILKGVYAKD